MTRGDNHQQLTSHSPARDDYTWKDNAALREHNTFHVDASACGLAEIADTTVIPALFASPTLKGRRTLVLGEGSNVLFKGDFNGVVIKPVMRGIDVLTDNTDATRLRVGAGEHWDDVVRWTLANGYRGLENLSLIPGSAGAAPVQNIGAYGVEIAEFIDTIKGFDLKKKAFFTLENTDCAFAYRDSLFKHEPDRWLITHVTLRLPKPHRLRTDYQDLQDTLASNNIKEPTAKDVAAAVISLRTRKLPSPAITGNAGSFFKNPIISTIRAAALQRQHPNLPCHAVAHGQTKLSAAWLIDQCGFKGQRHGDVGMAESHALVLVNHGRATGTDLWNFARHVRATVHHRFGITLKPEPRIIGD